MTSSIDPTRLSDLVTSFFTCHLSAERNVSKHTVFAYRDAMKLLLRFAAEHHERQVCRLRFEDLDRKLVLDFLMHLETDRGNSARTRNARLAAVHCFFRHVLDREPTLASQCQRILTIPFKKTDHPEHGYLTEEELRTVLSQIDRSSREGERDYVLLALLYDTGARIQEVLNVEPRDCHLANPAFVRIYGKGRKERLCPLLPQTARVVGRFVAEYRQGPDDAIIFRNRRGQPLTRHGALYLLSKYVSNAHQEMPSLASKGISPHTIRHTKAMHLLQSGVPLVTIKDVLGHSQLKSTEIYVQTDLQRKREALERAGSPVSPSHGGSPLDLAPDLLSWLGAL